MLRELKILFFSTQKFLVCRFYVKIIFVKQFIIYTTLDN